MIPDRITQSPSSQRARSVCSMIQLSREVRFALIPEPELAILQSECGQVARNSWAGWPVSGTVAPQLVLKCIVAGKPEPKTGYLCDIKRIDELLRIIVVEDLIPNFQPAATTYESLIRQVADSAYQRWDHAAMIQQLSLHASPQSSVKIDSHQPDMVIVTQQFEFSAAHRLHSRELSDAENASVYGKCNNLNGHGHNYVIEVSVASKSNEGHVDLIEFQSTVNRLVIDRLDHKHLNEDIEHFSEVLPSVENISIAIWNWLNGQFKSSELQSVRVYETPKTWAEYSGPDLKS